MVTLDHTDGVVTENSAVLVGSTFFVSMSIHRFDRLCVCDSRLVTRLKEWIVKVISPENLVTGVLTYCYKARMDFRLKKHLS